MLCIQITSYYHHWVNI